MSKKILIVKVGSDERTAGPEDLKAMKKALKRFQRKSSALKGYDVFVTHHAVDFDFKKV